MRASGVGEGAGCEGGQETTNDHSVARAEGDPAAAAASEPLALQSIRVAPGRPASRRDSGGPFSRNRIRRSR